jgi:hypothetical protein
LIGCTNADSLISTRSPSSETLAGRTKLLGCRKLYAPLGKEGASQAPCGFVFQLIQKPDDSLAWNVSAIGERHPANERTRDVYERAHKRLHGRYL